eukprot:5941509-Amphidinium_carterae.1
MPEFSSAPPLLLRRFQAIIDTKALTASKGGVVESQKRSHPTDVSAVVFLALMSLHTRRDRTLNLVGSPPLLSVSIHLRSNGQPLHSDASIHLHVDLVLAHVLQL